MIRPANGVDVRGLLGRIARNPQHYKECIVCAPFIDEAAARVLAELLVETRRASCGMQVLATPQALTTLKRLLPGPSTTWKRSLTALRRLHAKVYLLRGRKPEASEAIVTSANLTEAGLARNIEFGLHIRPSSVAGRELLKQILAFTRFACRDGD